MKEMKETREFPTAVIIQYECLSIEWSCECVSESTLANVVVDCFRYLILKCDN